MLITQLLAMNKRNAKTIWLLLTAFLLLQSCKKNPASHPNSSLRDTGEEIYKEALTISVDTSATTFEKLSIADIDQKKGIQSETYNYYTQNGNKTRWLYQDMPSRLFAEYLSVLDSIANDGLNPETYRRNALAKAVDSAYTHQLSDEYKANLDKEITASFFLLTQHLSKGRLGRKNYGDHSWIPPKSKRKNIDLLLNIDDNQPLSTIVNNLLPKSKQYQKMRKKYVLLKKQTLDSAETIDFANFKDFVYGYTAPVIEKLRKGLTPDGVLGKQTLYFINMNDTRTRDLLKLNMERMRVFNNYLGDHYAIVNIPDFKLSLFEKDSLLFETRVIVGKSATSTPIFTDTIQYVEFRPTWSVPQSIIKKEMIPQIVSQANPEKYKKRGYTMYENGKKVDPTQVNWNDPAVHKRGFYFVEAPSANNSLGLVKFILTNGMSIYLHDTPSKHFFDRDYRALSHGCIRVQNPSEFAYHLLKNEESETPWTIEKVTEAMQNTKRSQYRIALKTKYKVNIIYYTAWVDNNGEVVIKNDIYELDTPQLNEIKRFES